MGVTSDPHGAALQNTYFQNKDSQWWRLNYQGDGFYSIINRGSNKALSVIGDATTPGAKTTLIPFAKLDSQLWFIEQNEDGTHTILSKSSNKTIALDIKGCSPNDGAPVGTWTSNGLNCQKWAFRVR